MKVISGTAKGLSLLSPKGHIIRPTSGLVKEALFSMLDPYLYGAVFLDLYAGTGAVGIEALSRGAGKVVFVDNRRLSVELIKANLERCKLMSNADVVRACALAFLKHNAKRCDIIFLDPPYNIEADGVLDLIYKHKALTENGLIALERKTGNIPAAKTFDIFKNKRYNNTSVLIYKNL